ncbi:tRNA (guanine(46)-N(7))-methyltransferase TrmB [Colwellia sp. RE-S-Sl-9]
MKEQIEKMGDSKAIVTNQNGIHEKLEEIVLKHIKHPFKKPYQQHTQDAFDEIDKVVQAFDGEIILDSCCGVGQSTRLLAKRNPKALVIGVDKSANRINRNVDELVNEDSCQKVDNFYLIRADLNDFYRLVLAAKWPVTQHYVLYPNPWPKSKHVQRRWHGSAVFPDMLKIGDTMILRSNWRLYLEEFNFAVSLLNLTGKFATVDDSEPLTPFEAKYRASGQECFQLTIKIK